MCRSIIFQCSVADAGNVTVFNALLVLRPLHLACTRPYSHPQRLPHAPIRPKIAPSCEPCANDRPNDITMDLFPREAGDTKFQQNRSERLARGKQINSKQKKTDRIDGTLPLTELNMVQTGKRMREKVGRSGQGLHGQG